MVSSRLRVEFRVEPTTELEVIQSATDSDSVELDNAIYAGDGQWYQHLTVTTDLPVGSIRGHLSDGVVTELVALSPAEESDLTYYILALMEEPDPFVVSEVTEVKSIPHRIRLVDGQLTVTTSVEDWEHLKRVAEHLEASYHNFELLSTSQKAWTGTPLGTNQLKHAVRGEVSESQLELLAEAYRNGYFDVPQAVTAKELASILGTSQSTLSEALRNAQYTLFEILFGEK